MLHFCGDKSGLLHAIDDKICDLGTCPRIAGRTEDHRDRRRSVGRHDVPGQDCYGKRSDQRFPIQKPAKEL